jgi:hypothetical protein
MSIGCYIAEIAKAIFGLTGKLRLSDRTRVKLLNVREISPLLN